MARLKEFELPAIKLNDKTVEVLPTVSKPSPESPKSTMESDGLLASCISRLERLEDLENNRSVAFDSNEYNSKTPIINASG